MQKSNRQHGLYFDTWALNDSMPEGPSILIHTEALNPLLKGKKVIGATGNAKIEMGLLTDKKITSVKSWGKHLLICLPTMTIRIHFLMFGSLSIDEHIKQDKSLRLKLEVKDHVIYFYTCAIKILPGKVDDLYDWEADVLNDNWNGSKARKKLKALAGTMICDALLNQEIFAGVGNIIKNEVLYRVRLHPENMVRDIPPRKLTLVITEARNYSFDFLEWKREYTLRKHWLAHTKKTCTRCNFPFIKKYCGQTQRRSFFCNKCQVLYK
jgi:endonuclease-8